ncbi:hypothetical protein Poli38472_006858 [Pythium oligandrum]|uniref:Serine protease n=1 Tax=Pythium oligandrum TaxID=41045 RepID=A0A8K1FFI6_PYTOL|nr:hypothetical protein Poli38472_006858 [Pythium oligandrum]|eukprot:TMW56848.1 hypothetical protein Poli38472_006858 [Pythium oligandrum]
MFKKVAFLAAIALAVSTTDAWAIGNQNGYDVNEKGILQIGANEAADIQVKAGASREDVVSFPGAEYIAIRFDSFNLPAGDEVIVRNGDSSITYTYSGKGRNDAGAFYATYIPGDKAVVQYIARNKEAATTGDFGYKIPAFARGLSPRPTESICGGGDNSVPAKCLTNGTLHDTLPLAYERSKAVARLLINGTSLCTGWLAGSEGHLITNQHCIDDPALAASTDIEFNAESTDCADECKKQLGCAGTVVTKSSEFITNDEAIDYAVLKLPATADIKQYGFLQLRESGPLLGEEIYIPQHPVGWAKRVATHTENNEPAYIKTIHGSKSCGENQVGYSADTQGGSSGSPVLAWSDNYVVSLHHCGGCENEGADITDVIKDLNKKNIKIKDLLAPSTPAPSTSVPAPTTTAPAPTTTAPAPTPAPSQAGFCDNFKNQLSCQIWFWCNWNKSSNSCAKRY